MILYGNPYSLTDVRRIIQATFGDRAQPFTCGNSWRSGHFDWPQHYPTWGVQVESSADVRTLFDALRAEFLARNVGKSGLDELEETELDVLHALAVNEEIIAGRTRELGEYDEDEDEEGDPRPTGRITTRYGVGFFCY